jgi:AraC-like DNA-binding protein
MIIGALLKNADKKISEIAYELKVSAKTVKRRINMMMGSSAFYLQPILDLRPNITRNQLQIFSQDEHFLWDIVAHIRLVIPT